MSKYKFNKRKRNKIILALTTLIISTSIIGEISTIKAQTNNRVENSNQTKKYENTLDISKIAGYDVGVKDEDGGVAEIVKFNSDNNKFYLINGKMQTIDIVSLDGLKDEEGQVLKKEKSVNIADSVNSSNFIYGDLTSIDINIKEDIVVATVQNQDYKKSGKIVVMDYEGNVLEMFDAGIQPDNVKISNDGKYILSADEGEPREGKSSKDWDPEGSVTIVNYETKETKTVKFDDQSKIDKDVCIRNKEGGAVLDLEPEYIALSHDESKGYISLQENNAIATIDIKGGALVSVKSLGFKDNSIKGNEIDAGRDGIINIENLPIKSLYMPDSLSSVNINGKDYIVTANEGDATEWGKEDAEFINISKFGDYFEDKDLNSTDDTFGGMTAEEAKIKFEEMKASGNYDKLEVLTDMGDDAIYILGGRSFSIWDADNMKLVYDSGSDFEKITAEVLPEGFNWSNDDNELDKRSSKKGPEPEDIKIGRVGEKIYAFIGLERIGGVMTYDITSPSESKYANYINTRDFSDKIMGDVSPEGLEFVSSEKSSTGKPLILVGNEVSGTVSILQLGVDKVEESQEPETSEHPESSVKPEDTISDSDKLPQTGNTAGFVLLLVGSISTIAGVLTFKRK